MRSTWNTKRALLAAALSLAPASAGCSHSSSKPPEVVAGALRSCNDVVGGTLPRGWRQSSVISGPLALWFLGDDPRNLPPSLFDHRRGHDDLYRPYKVLAVLRQGADVTVVVPDGERGNVSLVYGIPWATTGMKVSQGFSAERFRACDNVESQYAGGFLVANPRCASLDVFARGERRQTLRIPFGASCP